MLAPVEKQGFVLLKEGAHLRCMFPDGTSAAALDALFDEVQRLEAGAAAPMALLFVGTTDRMLDAGARRVVYQRHGEFARRRVAVLGNHAVQGFIVNFLTMATGHTLTRYFTDEQAALRWVEGAG